MKLLFILGAILQLVADFQQVKESQMMLEPQISTGTLTYRAPDYLRWEYKTPTQLVWELDANKSNVSPQIQRLLKMIMLNLFLIPRLIVLSIFPIHIAIIKASGLNTLLKIIYSR